jgi:hypothetical protein
MLGKHLVVLPVFEKPIFLGVNLSFFLIKKQEEGKVNWKNRTLPINGKMGKVKTNVLLWLFCFL